MISGRALETIVDDRIATNMPSSSPDSASMICRCVIGASVGGAVGLRRAWRGRPHTGWCGRCHGLPSLTCCGCTGGRLVRVREAAVPGRGAAVAEAVAQPGQQLGELADLVVGPVAQALGEQPRCPPGQLVEQRLAGRGEAQDAGALVAPGRGAVRSSRARRRWATCRLVTDMSTASSSASLLMRMSPCRPSRVSTAAEPPGQSAGMIRSDLPLDGADGAELTGQFLVLAPARPWHPRISLLEATIEVVGCCRQTKRWPRSAKNLAKASNRGGKRAGQAGAVPVQPRCHGRSPAFRPLGPIPAWDPRSGIR